MCVYLYSIYLKYTTKAHSIYRSLLNSYESPLVEHRLLFESKNSTAHRFNTLIHSSVWITSNIYLMHLGLCTTAIFTAHSPTTTTLWSIYWLLFSTTRSVQSRNKNRLIQRLLGIVKVPTINCISTRQPYPRPQKILLWTVVTKTKTHSAKRVQMWISAKQIISIEAELL